MRNFTEETVVVSTNTMLYCPKCQQTFAEGESRFCPNDQTRLLPENSAGKNGSQTDGVFTNILNRQAEAESEKFSSVPRFSQIEPKFSRLVKPIGAGNAFDSDSDFELELELEPPSETGKSFEQTAVTEESFAESNYSDSEDLPLAEDETDSADNQIFESNSTTHESPIFDRDLPQNFVGQTIHDRYRITEFVEENDGGIVYLAEDKNLAGKIVVFRILPEADDSFVKNIFAEERIALAKLNHPNIANIGETGNLSDETAYLVSESVSGATAKDDLEKSGQFDALRAARVIRQTADALSEAHQNGVLHRNLKPENIVLNVDEEGIERVKLINFGVAHERLNETNLSYKSPEQVEGKISNISSDNYALAVVAYQLLTNRLPFNAESVGELLKLQREGLKINLSEIRPGLPPTVDEIIKKALSFYSFDRYPKAQTFGDEFFGEIFANTSVDDEAEIELPTQKTETEKIAPPIFKPVPVIEPKKSGSSENSSARTAKAAAVDGGVKATEDLAWEKRSPEPPSKPSPGSNLFSFLGIAVLLAALIGVWYYFINRPNATPANQSNESVNQNAAPIANAPIAEQNANVVVAPTIEEVEAPPSSRSITQPPDTLYFQNGREDLKGDLLKNYLGFSLYYPKNWRRNDAPKNFLDISKNAAGNLPVEQMIVTYYDSRGTFKEDTAAIFPSQVKITNESLKKILPNYKMLGEGKKTINNGWQTYEVQFQGTGKAGGKEITIWGKRLFIPTAIRGTKNGYVVTMLATSLSPEVKSAADVGVKGELASILETFEPNQNF